MITCDDREPHKPQNITKLIVEAGGEAEFERMDVGDYMCFDRDENLSLVTRKAGDLLQSTFSGHFSEELEGCMEMAHSYGPESKVFFICEGPWANYGAGLAHFKRRGGDWFKQVASHSCARTLWPNMQISLQTSGLYMVHTTSLTETAEALVAIYERGMEGWPTKMARSIKRPELKWTDDNRVAKLMALCKNLPEKVATQMLAEWGSIGTIVGYILDKDYPTNKKFNRLLETDGFGPTLLKNLEASLK